MIDPSSSAAKAIPFRDSVPDFRNLGVIGRVALLANLALLLPALATPGDWQAQFLNNAVWGEASLLLGLGGLALLAPWLQRWRYRSVALLATAWGALACWGLARWLENALPQVLPLPPARLALLGALFVVGLFYYFRLRNRAMSPLLAEARLQALAARIRPHFLFNSLNAVLSLIRSEPRRAEAALENLADLIRVLMADNNRLSSLAREIELARHYLDIEALRLGERLQVEWHIDKMPASALLPPLVLQPLLENAVYHGIEPAIEPGVIVINIYQARRELHIDIRNPYRASGGQHHAGNKMAMENIRERLALHFDAEASLITTVGSHTYQVHITLPHREAP